MSGEVLLMGMAMGQVRVTSSEGHVMGLLIRRSHQVRVIGLAV